MRASPVPSPACRIAALQGSSSEEIQALLAEFATRVAEEGYKVAGVVEVTAAGTGGACRRSGLRDLSTGLLTSISQDLGPGSTACNLDPAGLADACSRVESAIAAGTDLVILSKFGKQESQGGGLADAFRAAVTAGTPVLTAVSPALSQAWRDFAGPLSEFLPADLDAICAWWSHTKPASPSKLSIAGQRLRGAAAQPVT